MAIVTKLWQYPSLMQTPIPIQIGDIGVPSAQSVNITFTKVFQYQSWTAPLSESPETPQIDKWTPIYPNKIWDFKRQQFTYPNFFAEVFSMTTPESPHADAFPGYHPDKIWDVKRQQYLYPNVSFYPSPLPPVNIDAWIGYHPDILFRNPKPGHAELYSPIPFEEKLGGPQTIRYIPRSHFRFMR